MWADTLTREIEINNYMKELLVEGNFKRKNDSMIKFQCINEKLGNMNIQNRDNKKTQSLHYPQVICIYIHLYVYIGLSNLW